MRSTRSPDNSDNPYSVIAVGATWFVLLVVVIGLATRASMPFASFSGWRSTFGVVDTHLAALVTAASLLLFSGLWNLKPETTVERHVMRGVIALLVLLNWTVWCVALWLH